MKSKKLNYSILIGLISILSIYLLLVFPPAGDDFNRLIYLGLSFKDIVKESLGTHRYLNGRLLGNGMSFVFVSRISRMIIKFGLITGIILIIGKIMNKKLTSFLYTFLTLIFLNINIFREDIVWNAGFFNYIPPVFLILILALILITMEETLKKDIIVFFIAYFSCLFMENISLYMLFFPFILYFIYGISKKNIILTFLGSLLGNITMFSSPVYLRIFTKKDTYRSLASGGILDSIKNNWNTFQKYLSLGSVLIHIFILTILIYMLYKAIKEKDNKNKLVNIFAIISSVGIILTKAEAYWKLNLTLHILYYGSLLLMAFRLEERYKKTCLFACISMAISMGPLLFISPVGARNFFSSYILNLLIFLSLFYGNRLQIKNNKIYTLLFAIILIRLGFLSYIYTINWFDYKEMEVYIKESAENNVRTIRTKDYTYPKYVHDQNYDKLIKYYYDENDNLIPKS